VRLSVRELCSIGCEARKQESLFLLDVRVESRKLCFCSVRGKEAGSSVPARCESRERRKRFSCGK
jgi:hypothetical protein